MISWGGCHALGKTWTNICVVFIERISYIWGSILGAIVRMKSFRDVGVCITGIQKVIYVFPS
jgi:hypothetical protein